MNNKITNKLNVAIYCRLSREDGDSTVSSSIIHQKEILSEYCLKMNWHIFKVYVDDGYSGGNFNRPGWKSLISDIEKGNINILLTKDLSRLGRNYIETGYYTEEYFPSKKVRYIALNDNYDSNNCDNDFTPFKNIINQWYLKDISNKVKSVHESRMKKGKLPNGNIIPLYGYKHDNNNERIIDEVSGNIVRKLFDLYIKGVPLKEIKRIFSVDKIPTPAYYNYLNYNYNSSYWIEADENKKYDWNPKVITRIISNIQYTGTLKLKQKQTVSYKTHKRIMTKLDDVYVFNNRFPAIISKKIFEEANNIKNNKSKSRISLNDNTFYNLCICNNCGKMLSLVRNSNNSYKYYTCRRSTCNKHVNIKVKHIELILKNELLNLSNCFKHNEIRIKKYLSHYLMKEYYDKQNELDNEKKLIIIRNIQLETLIKKLLENNILNDLPIELIDDITKSYKDELNENLIKLNEIINKEKVNNSVNDDNKINFILNKLEKINEIPLSRNLITCFFESINISRKNKNNLFIKIKYKNIIAL